MKPGAVQPIPLVGASVGAFMRSSTNRLGQFGVDQFLKCFLDQIPEQKPDLITTKPCDELGQSCIMAVASRTPGPTYTTRWDAPRLFVPG